MHKFSLGTTFLDGPAAGQTLELQRSPILLRVVECRGKWDALDQLDDEPRPHERIYVYTLATVPTRIHVSRRPRSRSGFMMSAHYKFWPTQPDDSWLRTTARWDAWYDLVKGEVLTALPEAVRHAYLRFHPQTGGRRGT